MAAKPAFSYEDLIYFNKRYMHPDSLREAIAALYNPILELRSPEIWGLITACISARVIDLTFRRGVHRRSRVFLIKRAVSISGVDEPWGRVKYQMGDMNTVANAGISTVSP